MQTPREATRAQVNARAKEEAGRTRRPVGRMPGSRRRDAPGEWRNRAVRAPAFHRADLLTVARRAIRGDKGTLLRRRFLCPVLAAKS